MGALGRYRRKMEKRRLGIVGRIAAKHTAPALAFALFVQFVREARKVGFEVAAGRKTRPV